MSENKNAKTPADGPEYERGFVEGMQRQMQLHVNRVIREEPTAWLKTWSDGSLSVLKTKSRAFADHELEPLYTEPQKAAEWVGLTDEEIQDLSYLSQKIDEGNSPWFDRLGFARAIEQALKEKNHG